MKEEAILNARLLLVDDDLRSLGLLEFLLEGLDFQHIRKLSDSTRILQEFDDFQPDLIITDIEMPGLNGIELVESVRAHLPEDAYLPILVLTAMQEPKLKKQALLAGATDILFKPFDSYEMQMRVRSLLQTRMQYLFIQGQNRQLEKNVAARTAELEDALAELKAREQQMLQQERLRAFGEMASGVCHDFNNALMAIIGYTELLLQNPTLAHDRALLVDYLKTMNTAGRDASHVVSRLRDFYRPREESDVFSPVDINKLLEEVVPLTKPKWYAQAMESGRSICVKLELQKVPLVLGNASELRETFMNLVFNAVDAMPHGGEIILRSCPSDTRVMVEVADTGLGMSEDVRQRCLEPFFSTKGEKGTGLGLAMAFGIIRRHEGTLDIDTAPGKGTVFRLTMPGYRASGTLAGQNPSRPGEPLRVLVVDDEPCIVEIISEYLGGDGHHVMAASNGEEALRCLASAACDLVITDHGMPGMNGLQLAEAIRRLDSTIGILLLTGFDFCPLELPATIDCVLEKPVGIAELREALHRVVGRKSQQGLKRAC